MNLILKKLGPLANVEFDKLFLGQLLSHFADGTIQFVIISMLLAKSHSAGSTMALFLFLFMLPQFLLSILAGAFVDKIPRKLILSGSTTYRAILIIILLITIKTIELSSPLAYLFSFLTGCGAAFFYPAKQASLPNLIDSSQLKFANAINCAIGSIAFLFGAFLSNVLISNFGETSALIVVASMYLSSGIVLSTLKFKYTQKIEQAKQSIVEDIKLATSYLKTHKRTLSLVLMSICLSFIVAIFSNTLNSLITDYYNLEFSILTKIRTILGIGIVTGMAVTVFLARIMRISHLFAVGFLTLCIALITSPFCDSVNEACFAG